jgi:neutral ceramidase
MWKIRMRCFCCIAIVLAAVLCGSATGAAEKLQAGVAVVDITPPIPFRMHGYFYERLSTGIKDPLHARAVVFQQGKEMAALVFCDVVGIPASVTAPARKKASEATGIPDEHIGVNGTHTHTGPQFFMSVNDFWHDQAVAKFGKDPYDSDGYRGTLVDKIAHAVIQAKAALAPVDLKSGFAREDRISFNRRYHMKGGAVRFNPPLKSPDIIGPAGPIDPQVGIISLSKVGAKEPSSVIVSFAMHPDTTGGGTLYSADYIYALEQRMKKTFGPEFTTLFGIGTCGDINNRNVHEQKQRMADELGSMLGDTVVNAIENDKLSPMKQPSLAVRSTKVPAKLQEVTEADIAKASQNMVRLGQKDFPFSDAVQACKVMDVVRLKKLWGDTVPLEVQAYRLDDDTAIVTLPSEIFVNLGLAIKAASPFKTTLVIELTNDSVAYIPTKQAFLEGSYEVTNSRVERGTGEKLVEAAVGLLKELK